MRLRALPASRLTLTGNSLSQVCVGGRQSLDMWIYTYDLRATNCGLLVQGKLKRQVGTVDREGEPREDS